MDTALSPPVGRLLGGRYHVGSQIARGGMATVYLGTDTRLDRVVAIKIAHPELAGDAEFVRRFIGEARSAARLSSPNVVAVYDQGSDGPVHYIAMEYVPGRTLRQLLNERGRLPPAEALAIMAGVLSGLAAAHQAGFAHRDVKPENVLLTAGGGVKVADFGLARAVAGAVHTRGGMIIGTAAYLAPEQVEGGTSDARTDVYAAGVMLFELLTGTQPHTGESPLAVAYKHVHEVVRAPSSVLPGLPPALDALVAMATSRDPDLRPANAGQFLRAVSEVRNGHVPHGRADPGGHLAWPAGDGWHPSGPLLGAPHPSGPLAEPPSRGSHPCAPAGDRDLAVYAPPSGGHPTDAYPALFDGYLPSAARSPVTGAAPAARPPGQAWQSGPGLVGASALPSLRPDTGPAAVAPRGDGPGAQANPTLIVPAGAGLAGGDGFGPGGPGRRGRPGRGGGLSSGRLLYLAGALAVALVAAVAAWWLGSGQYVSVPHVRGFLLATAKAEMTNAGLRWKVGRPARSPLPRGEVVATSPATGSRVASGSVVTLIVSLGPQMIQVPNVSGQPLAQAEAALRHAGLRIGAVTRSTSSTVQAGYVISTSPSAYARCSQYRPVGITVSAGQGLPNFVGMQLGQAQQAAQQGGYTLNPVPAQSNQPPNTIIAQSPQAGTPVTPGEVVTVQVSQGPPGVQVPNVVGMSLPQAVNTRQQAGFQVSVVHQGPGNRVGRMSPTGTQPKGATITVYVGWFSGL